MSKPANFPLLEAVYTNIELDAGNHLGAPGGSTELSQMVEAAIAKARGRQ
jgi:hypothetical protein